MKKIVLAILLLTLFNSGFAQQVDRIQRGQRGYIPEMRLNEETYIDLVDPFVEIEKMMPKCITVLGLDAFEQEIVKGMLLKKFERQNAILSDEKNTRNDRKKKIDDLDKEFLIELGTILKPEKVDKFRTIDFTETKAEKKKRKKKKRNN